MTRTKTEITNDIINYFKENEDTFTECIEELDGYNGYLNDNRYYEMYMLDEFYSESKPSEIIDRIYYGHDEEDSYTDEYGQKHYSEFNPNKEYFRYNGYGNLVSTNYKDYSAHLDHYAIEQMSDNRQWIDTIDRDDTLSALFDELENIEE